MVRVLALYPLGCYFCTMAAGRFPLGRVPIILAQRAGAALGLGLALGLARGFWDSALDSFAEGLAEGLGALVIALGVTLFALVIVYASLGSLVDQLTVRLLAVAGGRANELGVRRIDISATAWADVLAVPGYAALGVLFVGWGIADAHATWALLGFTGFALSGLSAVSAVVHFLLRSRLRSGQQAASFDHQHTAKGGEMAGVFVSLAVLGLTLSASFFASIPVYRYGGGIWPLAYGDWAEVCVGDAAGCHARQVMTFQPEARRPVLLEVVAKEPATLRSKGSVQAVDAAGKLVRLARESGTAYGWQARFVPPAHTVYEVVLDKPGSYSVRYRSAP